MPGRASLGRKKSGIRKTWKRKTKNHTICVMLAAGFTRYVFGWTTLPCASKKLESGWTVRHEARRVNATANNAQYRSRKGIAMQVLVLLTIAACVASSRFAMAQDDARPAFSWDTVPVYIHFGKSSGPLSDEELRFVAETSNFVCFEKGHGIGRLGSTEAGTAHDALRLKELNPDVKVLFYWNSFLNYRLYDACDEFAEHTEWIFRDDQGEPIYKSRTLEQYDLLDPQFRQWWASIAGRAVREYHCNGIFMDAMIQPRNPNWMRRGWGVGNEGLVLEAQIDQMRRAKESMGDDSILLYNGLRSSDRTAEMRGDEYLPYADGATVEHFGAFHCRSPEAIVRDMKAIEQAGQAGKIVVVKGWPDPDFNWTNTELMRRPPKQLIEEAREKIDFSLACFLIAAQRDSYFCYSWGYREQHGSLVDYPELQRPLGEPLGDAVRDGWTFTRSFEHLDVSVDINERTVRLDWEE
jgi:hypothetical protein